MDFSNLQQESSTDETPAPVELVDRKGNPYLSKSGKPWTWYVRGEYSKAAQRFERQLTDKALKRARRGDEFDADDAEQTAIDRIFAVSDRFEHIEDAKGVPVPFTRENVAAILKAAPWIVPQLRKRMQGHADFFAKDSGR